MNESVVPLLDAISEVRRPLLEMYASGHLLTTEKLGSNISICSSCRGEGRTRGSARKSVFFQHTADNKIV